MLGTLHYSHLTLYPIQLYYISAVYQHFFYAAVLRNKKDETKTVMICCKNYSGLSFIYLLLCSFKCKCLCLLGVLKLISGKKTHNYKKLLKKKIQLFLYKYIAVQKFSMKTFLLNLLTGEIHKKTKYQ